MPQGLAVPRVKRILVSLGLLQVLKQGQRDRPRQIREIGLTSGGYISSNGHSYDLSFRRVFRLFTAQQQFLQSVYRLGPHALFIPSSQEMGT